MLEWRVASATVTIAAATTFLMVCARAVLTADTYWDTLAYHWPFAARLAGLCDGQCFVMPASYEQRWLGFPKLWHALQGLLWRISGAPSFADLLSIGMVLALCCYLKRRFSVPLAWSWLGFIAIPEAQIQLTSSYIDLPANTAITIAVMAFVHMISRPADNNYVDIAIALLGLGVAAGSKLQLVPICLLIWIVIMALQASQARGLQRRWVTVLIMFAAGAVVLLPQLALNTYRFGNPVYPIAVDGPLIRFAGPESMMQAASLSDVALDLPGPVRWLASVLEFDAFRGRPLPWSLGQGDVPQSSPSFRMGGYFGTYVLALMAVLGWSLRTSPRGASLTIMFVGMSALCALLPSSHELRYYMFWMISLVSLALALAHSPLFERAEQTIQRNVLGFVIVIAASSVILVTGGAYLRSDKSDLQALVDRTNPTVATVPDGGTLCVLYRHRTAFLYSKLFHPGRDYTTRALWGDEPASCTKRLVIGQ